ncbi:hypothetical protein F4805DRAFT_449434 [Annulohypoxylon moriforme]|nr:hypothetical protein F4805DRAFT_449434 [Annulohypoxylon moriforme]
MNSELRLHNMRLLWPFAIWLAFTVAKYACLETHLYLPSYLLTPPHFPSIYIVNGDVKMNVPDVCCIALVD